MNDTCLSVCTAELRSLDLIVYLAPANLAGLCTTCPVRQPCPCQALYP